MKKVSLVVAVILSSLMPGAGLLLVQKNGWFAAYMAATVAGFCLLFFLGLGMFVLPPIWVISFIHTIVAVLKHNSLVQTA